MSASAQLPVEPLRHMARLRLHLPTLPEALASLLRTIVVALFVLTFVLQPFLIPSESMERTLLVGDFLLFNKQVYAPPGPLSRWLLPYRPVERGDIVVFHHPKPPLLVKRVIGLPGDLLRIQDGRVFVNGVALDEPYAAFEPAPPNDFRDNFPAHIYTDPQVDPEWWRQMQSLTRNGGLWPLKIRPPVVSKILLHDARDRRADAQSGRSSWRADSRPEWSSRGRSHARRRSEKCPARATSECSRTPPAHWRAVRAQGR